ncbi:MAG: T9SS type A sorting domain-containing protein [Candidatus Cloacimonetes bacterium]|nr:T9SS type A sorting domain-containing protein [Candidatus Cloacimonadota bacterium]MCF7813141.1 T9SS type A sorting domain-containing protein [Candidatus Cloacimonadota bacterium]MCF7867589.1 T9SS type A sorting domain-containing protein [Candidatus Cloacimonadota bacterium]MCF7883136.1 T9SS type A sorting domain-containing protein [Candidatus Cloacimonadota bacterium]
MKKVVVLLVVLTLLAGALLAKGTCDQGRSEPTSAVFNPNVMQLVDETNDELKTNINQQVTGSRDWQVIKSEDFEGAWPNDWDCYSDATIDCYWSDNNDNSSVGSWSGWCADGGDDAPTEQIYPNDMNAWMVYGPFSLADAVDADIEYDLWYETESDYDYFKLMASIDGTNYYGLQWSGSSGGWQYENFDLTDVYTLGDLTGQPEVWIAYIFTSDYSINYEGAYVDEIYIWKDTGDELLMEDFSSGTFPPAGWSVMGDGQENWSEVGTDNAGGTVPELEFSWTPSFVGSSYFTSPVIATAGMNSVNLEYTHMLDDYDGAGYSIGIATTSNGGTTWNVASQVFPTGDIGPESVSLTINTPDVGSNNFQVAFWFDGDSFSLDYWYIDDIALFSGTEAGQIVQLTNQLNANYPNPFNPTTTISFSLVQPAYTILSIYNVKGELVKTLISDQLTANDHTVTWNGKDNTGKTAASGVYFYKLKSGNYTSSRKMLMLK